MFGGRCGRCCATALEIAAGETDLVADRVKGQPDGTEMFAAQKRRLITSRMIASQAVRPQRSACRVLEAARTSVLSSDAHDCAVAWRGPA
jgi:hypothetical protein